jgi:hypothetical protein
MKKLATVAIAVLLVVAAVPNLFADDPGTVVPPDARMFGKNYAQWSATWWQWALSLPPDQNPWFDEVGDMIASGQSGPVWFLTGVFNVSGTAVRTCTIPAGKYLFFPVINNECSTLEAPPWYGKTHPELAACAQSVTIANAHATIDGVAVEDLETDYTVLSPLYNFWLPEVNAWGLPGPLHGRSVSYGTWLMLRPLAPGTHVINFGGTYPELSFTLDITYILTVQ